jgi:dihydrofolate synthase/folylpolyglutamate synthase
MNHPEIARWLYSLKNHGSKFGIDRMALLVEMLGHPERAFPSILVAGSNGKGSTAAMLEAIYRAHGLRTGLYTSPHLVRLGERVQVNRSPLSDEAIAAYTEELRPFAERLTANDPDDAPSFFEFMTAMAFLEFQRKAVDIAIVEVGLGGRLDATNILTPRLSIITSISLEHTAYLGNTLQQIAAEKGGILTPDTPAVLGLLPPEAQNTLHEIARERGSPLFEEEERFRGEPFPKTNLAGQHHRANAGLALLATEILQQQFPVSPDTTRTALRNVNWPARWQTFPLSRNRRLILDVAHNAECAAAIDPLLAQLTRETGRLPLVVTGVLGVERARPLLAVLAKHAASLRLVRPEQDRACDFAELESCIPPGFSGSVTRDSLDALFPAPGECSLGADGDSVVVAGSVYLAGEVLGRFLPGGIRAESELQDRLSGLEVRQPQR